MFAFFMAALLLTVSFLKLVKDFVREKQNRNYAIKKGDDTWYDRNNVAVDVKTNIPYRIEQRWVNNRGEKPRKGDLVKVNAYTGKEIHNYTQDKRNQIISNRVNEKENAIKNGEKYYIYEAPQRWHGLSDTPHYECDPYKKLPKSPYMWADINTNEKFFVWAGCTQGKVSIPFNAMWNIATKRLERIVDQEWYSNDALVLIKERMEEENIRRGNNDYSWCMVTNWSRELHNKWRLDSRYINYSRKGC